MLILNALIASAFANQQNHNCHHSRRHQHVDVKQTLHQEIHLVAHVPVHKKKMLNSSHVPTPTATSTKDIHAGAYNVHKNHTHGHSHINQHELHAHSHDNIHGHDSHIHGQGHLNHSGHTSVNIHAIHAHAHHAPHGSSIAHPVHSTHKIGMFPIIRPIHHHHSESTGDWYKFLPANVRIVKEKHLRMTGHPLSLRRVVLREHKSLVNRLTELFDRYQSINFLLGYTSIDSDILERAINSYKERIQFCRSKLPMIKNLQVLDKLRESLDSCIAVVNLLENSKRNHYGMRDNLLAIKSRTEMERELFGIQRALGMHKKQAKGLKKKLKSFLTSLGHDPRSFKSKEIIQGKNRLVALEKREIELLQTLHDLEHLATQAQLALEAHARTKTNIPGASLNDMELQLNSYLNQISSTKGKITENESQLDKTHKNVIKAEMETAQNEEQVAMENKAEAAEMSAEKSKLEKQAQVEHEKVDAARKNAENLKEIADKTENGTEKNNLIESAKNQEKNAELAEKNAKSLAAEAQSKGMEADKLVRQSKDLKDESTKMKEQAKTEQAKMLKEQLDINLVKKNQLQENIKKNSSELSRLADIKAKSREGEKSFDETKELISKVEKILKNDKDELMKIEIEIKNLHNKLLYRSKSMVKIDDFADRKSRLEAFFKVKKYKEGNEKETDLKETLKCQFRAMTSRIFFTFFPIDSLFHAQVGDLLDNRSQLLNSIKEKPEFVKSLLKCLDPHKKEGEGGANEACIPLAGIDSKLLETPVGIESRFKDSIKEIHHDLLKCGTMTGNETLEKLNSLLNIISKNIDANHLRSLIAFIMRRSQNGKLPLKPLYTANELKIAKGHKELEIFLEYIPIILNYIQTGQFEVALSEIAKKNLAPTRILRKYGIKTLIHPFKYLEKVVQEQPVVSQSEIASTPKESAPIQPEVSAKQIALPPTDETLAQSSTLPVTEESTTEATLPAKEKQSSQEKIHLEGSDALSKTSGEPSSVSPVEESQEKTLDTPIEQATVQPEGSAKHEALSIQKDSTETPQALNIPLAKEQPSQEKTFLKKPDTLAENPKEIPLIAPIAEKVVQEPLITHSTDQTEIPIAPSMTLNESLKQNVNPETPLPEIVSEHSSGKNPEQSIEKELEEISNPPPQSDIVEKAIDSAGKLSLPVVSSPSDQSKLDNTGTIHKS